MDNIYHQTGCEAEEPRLASTVSPAGALCVSASSAQRQRQRVGLDQPRSKVTLRTFIELRHRGGGVLEEVPQFLLALLRLLLARAALLGLCQALPFPLGEPVLGTVLLDLRAALLLPLLHTDGSKLRL